MSVPPRIRAIHPRNLLSFGPDTPEIPLQNLNILIGPNGSGKSNLIETICLLRATPKSLEEVIRKGGGIREWIYKPNKYLPASVSAVVSNAESEVNLRHSITFGLANQTFMLLEEKITREFSDSEGSESIDFYTYSNGDSPKIWVEGHGSSGLFNVNWHSADSVLAQIRDPERFAALAYLSDQYSLIRAYREWYFGRNTIFREPQRADMRNNRLEEDFSNLGLFLNFIRRTPEAKNKILTNLRDLYEGIDDFDVNIEGGTVQVFLTEGPFTIPAPRLSDGTLRYLCLLAILCDPNPPPLICIEEPELGLHPDILPKIADLLVEASERTQLIVTTHSDILIDAMTERPESVLVCEKHDGQTHIERLSSEGLAVWLEKYRLGELWTRGEIGGTRW